MEKTEEHFQEAMEENKNSFHAVDPDADGERDRERCPYRTCAFYDPSEVESSICVLVLRSRDMGWVQSEVSGQQRFQWAGNGWKN